MVQINMGSKEITLKVVYYGPALSGKTSNLQMLHEMMDEATRSHMLSLDTKDDRTLYFDFLPVEFDTVGGFSVKMKLFTVPGQVMHKSTRKVVLAGADAIAFIADSQRTMATANRHHGGTRVAGGAASQPPIEVRLEMVQTQSRALSRDRPGGPAPTPERPRRQAGAQTATTAYSPTTSPAGAGRLVTSRRTAEIRS